MATYQKRGDAWRAIVRKAGTNTSRTFDTKAEAQRWATAMEAKIDQQARDEPDQPAGVHRSIKLHNDTAEPSVAEYLQRYADEVSPSKRGGRWEVVRLSRLIRDDPEFQKAAKNFAGPDLAAWRDKRLRSVKPASVIRELNLISAVFSCAIREWGLMIPVNPCNMISKPRKPRARTQRVSDADRDALVEALLWDKQSVPSVGRQWVAAVLCFALETAMRKSEIMSLRWKDVHIDGRYVHLDMTKNGEARDVPLSTAALGILAKLGTPKPQEKVFKVSMGNVDKLMRQTRIRCGLKHVRLHDARREATTNFANKLSNVLELAAVTGHKELRMLNIYYAPKVADLAAKLG